MAPDEVHLYLVKNLQEMTLRKAQNSQDVNGGNA